MNVAAALEPVGGEDARRLLTAYLAEVEYELGARPARSPAEPEELSPPSGGFVVVRDEAGRAVACGGFRRLDDRACEVKRMYVAPDSRGHGIGRLLLTAIEAAATDAGYARARLDTAEPLQPALALYRSAGYRPIAPYNDNPHAAYWLEKRLGV